MSKIVSDAEIAEFSKQLKEYRDYIRITLADKKKYASNETDKIFDRLYYTILTDKLCRMGILCGEFWKRTLDMATAFEEEIEEEPKEVQSVLEGQLKAVREMVEAMTLSDTPVVEKVSEP